MRLMARLRLGPLGELIAYTVESGICRKEEEAEGKDSIMLVC